MRIKALLACLSLLLFSVPALAGKGPEGRYRLAGGPDVASEILIKPDGHFQYFLIAGALDEHAEGHWVRSGPDIQLFTDPKPVPAVFSTGAVSKNDEEKLTLLVIWPNGRGIAGIDLRIGFASGEPVEGYTQDYGWFLPLDETRVPLWIELVEPIHRVVSPRFPLDLTKGNALRFTLTPNDIEVFDFQGTRVEVSRDGLLMHRNGGEMKFVRSGH